MFTRRFLSFWILSLISPVDSGDWPQFTGPMGSTGHHTANPAVLKDLNEARLVWESEIRDLPASKLYIQNKLPVPSGGMQDLIKVGNTLIYAHMWPSGDDLPNEKEGPGGSGLDRKLSCDDVIVAIDAQNGKTLWRKVYAEQGLYSPPTKRGGYGIYPASDGTKVYGLSSGGWLFALSLENGQEVWRVKAEPFYSLAEGRRQSSLASGKRQSDDMLSSLVVAGDTLVVPMFTRTARDEPGYDLAGFDTKTGERRWLLPGILGRNTTPVLWQDEKNVPLLLVANGFPDRTGFLRQIDPQNGTEFWKMPTPMPQVRQLAVNGDQVFLSSPAPDIMGAKSKPVPAHTFSAWKISRTGAERLWTMPEEGPYQFPIRGDSEYMPKVMPSGDVLYISRLVQTESGRTVAVQEHDAATGKILRSTGGFPGCWANVVWPLNNDSLMLIGDTEHWHLGFPDFTLLDRSNLKASADRWIPGKGNGPGGKMKHSSVTAYEVPIPYFISDGCLYLRGIGGPGVRCYDLRRPQPSLEHTE